MKKRAKRVTAEPPKTHADQVQSKTDFRSIQALRDEGKKWLEHPVGKLMLGLCAHAPVRLPTQQAGVPYDTTCAHVLAQCVGGNKIIDELFELCEPLPEGFAPQSDRLEPFKHITLSKPTSLSM